jgi:lysophospholipase L1-like esterase
LTRNILLFIASVILALILAEGILRLIPLDGQRIRGDRIVLPASTRLDIANFRNPKLPERLLHTRNNIGFRGPNWYEEIVDTNLKSTSDEPAVNTNSIETNSPAITPNSDKIATESNASTASTEINKSEPTHTSPIRIFAVGGSTTECFYLPDGYDWPAVMARELNNAHSSTTLPPIWVNNAGLDGHSTFGHLILLEDILVNYSPDYILYLVGANDVGRLDLNDHNNAGIISGTKQYRPVQLLQRATHFSELATLADNLLRGMRARKLGVTHQNIDFKNHGSAKHTQAEMDYMLYINKTYFLAGYRQRLETLVNRTLSLGITPILLTQPVPYGPSAVDPSTGTNLSEIEVRGSTGYLRWHELELYNDVTRELAHKYQIKLIDLEKIVPKDSRYFYDFIHFTPEGALKIGHIVAEAIKPEFETR